MLAVPLGDVAAFLFSNVLSCFKFKFPIQSTTRDAASHVLASSTLWSVWSVRCGHGSSQCGNAAPGEVTQDLPRCRTTVLTTTRWVHLQRLHWLIGPTFRNTGIHYKRHNDRNAVGESCELTRGFRLIIPLRSRFRCLSQRIIDYISLITFSFSYFHDFRMKEPVFSRCLCNSNMWVFSICFTSNLISVV